MRRVSLFLMLGIFCAAIFGSAISVYILHDVDQDKIGHWNEAFAGLCAESVFFTLVIGGAVTLLTFFGWHLFDLKGHNPRAILGFLLGVGTTVSQYPWEFAARKANPNFAELSLYLYLIFAVILCTVVIVRNGWQLKISQVPLAPFDGQ